MGDKHDDLRDMCAVPGLQAYWDGSHHWGVSMEGYGLLREDRKGRQRGGLTLYVREQLELRELCLGMEEGPTGGLRVRIKGDTIVGACYSPPDQEEQVDHALYRQI